MKRFNLGKKLESIHFFCIHSQNFSRKLPLKRVWSTTSPSIKISRNKNVIPIFVLVKNLFPTSRFHPVYSTVCHCEIFLGERNSFSFRGVVVKSTFDLVNARPRSFDDVQPDRDANTVVKPWARKARSLGTRSKAWNTIRIESTSIPRVERFVDSILPQQIFSPVLFRATICFVKGRFFARKLDHLSSLWL